MTYDGVTDDDVRSGKVTFPRRWRGYDPEQVDPLLRAAEQAAFSESVHLRREFARRLRDAEFPVIRRGYDRDTVDLYTQCLIENYLRKDRDETG